VVVVILDGLGALQLADRHEVAPWLGSHQLEPITSVAPSTTAAALTTMTTGVPPGVHGLLGYRFALGGDVLQSLRWTVEGRDATGSHPPEKVQRIEPNLVVKGRPVPYIGKKAFATSSFTRAHLRGANYIGIETPEEFTASVVAACTDNHLVVAYHDTIDKIAHATGLAAEFDAAVGEADALVTTLRAELPSDVAVVVTADHGQVDVGSAQVSISGSTLALVDKMSGEGRFRWLHAFPGSASDLSGRVAEELHESCWVLTRRQVLDSGWLGEVADDLIDRLGDVAVVPFVDAFVPDPAEPLEVRMKGRHGSLTAAEMWVPLIVG